MKTIEKPNTNKSACRKILIRSLEDEVVGAAVSIAIIHHGIRDAGIINKIPPLHERRMAGGYIGNLAYDVYRFTREP